MMIVIPRIRSPKRQNLRRSFGRDGFPPASRPCNAPPCGNNSLLRLHHPPGFSKTQPRCPRPQHVDKWKSPAFDLIYIGLKYSIPLLGILHSLIVLSGPHPPAYLCPNPQNLNPALFTWSLPSIVVFNLLSTFGNIRLWTYRALGKNFVYQLNRPSHLVTTGPYAYAQHPSYPAVLLVWYTLHASLTRLDGGSGSDGVGGQQDLFPGFTNLKE